MLLLAVLCEAVYLALQAAKDVTAPPLFPAHAVSSATSPSHRHVPSLVHLEAANLVTEKERSVAYDFCSSDSGSSSQLLILMLAFFGSS
jgi:hypothetical protein